jgi:3-phenylpropionate/trans-cinnamate dioxygenase ferredoxin reductase subunit
MTADAAVRGIREIDHTGSIGLLSSETSAPYNRPPLSKALWKGGELEDVWRKTDTIPDVNLHLQTTAMRIDLARKSVIDDRQAEYAYEKLLLATGGTPRRLPFGGDSVIYFRTLSDYHQLRTLAETGNRFVVIGGGFIGSEIAAALSMNGKQVVMIFRENGISALAFPPDLSAFVSDFYRQKGVELITGKFVEGVDPNNGRTRVRVSGNVAIEADGVVAGLGIIPSVHLASTIGLKVSNGIVVDEFLRTSADNVFAAGDVAAFHNPALDKRIRLEHEDNANTMGRIAGRNMAGATERYAHLPSFYSDLFELGYEAVGELDPQLQTVSKWKEQFREGVVYYMQQSRIRGVLLWNVWEQVDTARALISSNRVFSAADLNSLIPL